MKEEMKIHKRETVEELLKAGRKLARLVEIWVPEEKIYKEDLLFSWADACGAIHAQSRVDDNADALNGRR